MRMSSSIRMRKVMMYAAADIATSGAQRRIGHH
jgi:hypothetical protein